VIPPVTGALASKDHADHPHAVALGDCHLHAHRGGGKRCDVPRVHEPHPYGPIHPDGGLTHWCEGRTV
jgi:hypothetical protein